jgi:hypothetical protein
MMTDSTEKKEKVTVRFVKSPGYRTIPVNGAWGVLTADGNILCDFTLDSWTPPSEIDYKPNDLIEANELARRFKDGSEVITREVQVGIVMNKKTAQFLVSWLQQFLAASAIETPDKPDAE